MAKNSLIFYDMSGNVWAWYYIEKNGNLCFYI